MKKDSSKSIWGDNRVLLLISFVVAVVLWTVVVTYVSTSITQPISNIKVNLAYNQADYQKLGLDIIETDVETVDVVVEGPRSVVGSLTADDIIVYPNMSTVSEAGKYTLTLTADKVSVIKEFKIKSISKSHMTVRFDRLIEKTLDVNIDMSNVLIPNELMSDKPYSTPSSVTIRGPEYKVNVISKVVAKVPKKETLSQTTALAAQLMFLDKDGAEVSADYLTVDTADISITVPVLKEVSLPVKVEYINVPQGFDTATLQIALSYSNIHLAVPSKIADSLSDFIVGYIDLKNFEPDKAYVFDVKLPSGYKNMENLEKITATISSKNLVSKTVAVSEIKVINAANQNISVLTQIINNVEIIGTKEAVEALSSGSVIAQIDASRLTVAQGQQTIEVDIIIPSTDKAYVKGTYTVTIKN